MVDVGTNPSATAGRWRRRSRSSETADRLRRRAKSVLAAARRRDHGRQAHARHHPALPRHSHPRRSTSTSTCRGQVTIKAAADHDRTGVEMEAMVALAPHTTCSRRWNVAYAWSEWSCSRIWRPLGLVPSRPKRTVMLTAIREQPLSVDELIDAVQHEGAIATFIGLVRDQRRPRVRLRIPCLHPDGRRSSLPSPPNRGRDRGVQITCAHRVGELGVATGGVCGSPRTAPSAAACRELIERVKARVQSEARARPRRILLGGWEVSR